MESPQYRILLEDSLKRTLADLFAEPTLGELFDGLLIAVQRITRQLRDEVLVMKVEKEKAQGVLDMLVELASHRAEILTTFAQAGTAIARAPSALPAGGGT